MADKHPYVNSPGGLSKAISHFRNTFPSTVNAATLKQLGIAPNNESYVLNVLRFLDFIDDDDKKTDIAATIFSNHADDAFAGSLAPQVRSAYSSLFKLYDDESWNLDKESLIGFFRNTDHTSAAVGGHQATTFQLLAGFAGHREAPQVKAEKSAHKKPATRPEAGKIKSGQRATKAKNNSSEKSTAPIPSESRVGLTVRIEINLPADGDQEAYDRIFKSIRENLLND